MLDIRLIRSDPDGVRAALTRRGPAALDALDRVTRLDERWRSLTAAAEELRAEQNRASKALRGAPSPEQREELQALSARGRELSDQEASVRAEREVALAELPNLPAVDAPDEDTELKIVGEQTPTGLDHLALAGSMIDMERGARLSGSRFAYLRGELVLVELALVQFVIGRLIAEGFEPVIPPVLVREHGALRDRHVPRHRAADLPAPR